jgi:endonuclease V-like protein UPF0215 family
MGPYPLQITVTEFQILLGVVLTAGGAFAGWLYRHERWFRNIVFPVIQSLTGKDPRGTQVDSTNEGHFQETENRLQKIEADVECLNTSVEKLQRRQDRHNQKTESYLRRVVAEVEGIEPGDVDEPYFRRDGGPEPDFRDTGRDGGGEWRPGGDGTPGD